MAFNTDNPDVPSPAYSDMARHWQLPRSLMGGSAEMQSHGEEYLPREPKESTNLYRIRLKRSTLYPAFSQAVRGLAARPFRKPSQLSEKAPEALKDLCDNLDRSGRNLTKFSLDIFAEALCDGISYIWVEYPNTAGQQLTAADEKIQQIRPYFIGIKAPDLLEALVETDPTGRQRLARVRIKETTWEPDKTKFGQREVTRIRVLYPDRWELWERPSDKRTDWIVVQSGESTLGVIPIVPVYCGWVGYFQAYPPLEDLAWLNLKHWQSQSDQDNILHVARVPILAGSGFAKEGSVFEIGPGTMVSSENPAAKMYYVEHSGAAIGAGRTSLLDLEQQMAAIGWEPLVARATPGDLTATGRAIDSAEADTKLQAWTRSLEDSLSQAFRLAAQWMHIKDAETKVTLNSEFGLSLKDTTELTALLETRKLRDMSRESLLSEWKRRGVLPDTFDIEAESEKLDSEGPPLGFMTNQGAPGAPGKPNANGNGVPNRRPNAGVNA